MGSAPGLTPTPFSIATSVVIGLNTALAAITMNGKLRKAVVRQFSARLKEELPQFIRTPAPAVADGSVVYWWELKKDFWFFLELLPNPKSWEQCFMIEIGWNTSCAYPKAAVGRWHDKPPETSPYGYLRLPSLYKEEWESGLQPWWYLGACSPYLTRAEKAALRVVNEGLSQEERRKALHLALEQKRIQSDVPLDVRLGDVEFRVRDAIEKLKKYGLPYLKSVAAAHNAPV